MGPVNLNSRDGFTCRDACEVLTSPFGFLRRDQVVLSARRKVRKLPCGSDEPSQRREEAIRTGYVV